VTAAAGFPTGVVADDGEAAEVGELEAEAEGDARVAPEGVTAALSADHAELPFTLVECTSKLYAVPLDSPPTVTERLAADAATVRPPGDTYTV
jgi:hypothetical protein